jgi:glycosyltransferase involved in cell wall biosynthesis
MHVKNTKSKGVVLYDFLLCKGGAEQVTLDMMNIFQADLCVAFSDPAIFQSSLTGDNHVWEISRHIPIVVLRTLMGMYAFENKTQFLDQYDWAMFSGSNAPLAVKNHSSGLNLYYCHTIPRFAYDLKNFYEKEMSFYRRPLFKALVNYIRPKYENAMNQMDMIIANSENVRNRIQKYLGKESIVVHPPCHIDRFSWIGQGDYYLSTSRLEPHKRVQEIVKAFKEMPGKKLVVASGGSEYSKLKKMAANASNIQFAGWLTDEQLRQYVGNAIATIYIPIDEDFGMSPVESMAAGKPVIGVAEGGLLETIEDEKTGILIKKCPDIEDIKAAVNEMTPERVLSMRRGCERKAELFSIEKFRDKITKIIEQNT